MSVKNWVWLDMDGTIADLYGDKEWKTKLEKSNPEPYEKARPLVSMWKLSRMIKRLQKKGYKVGVLSWLSKNSTVQYENKVRKAKIKWLRKHLPRIMWDDIKIVPYGVAKQNFKQSSCDILFDDEERNRNNWGLNAYTEKEIFKIMKGL